MSRVFTRPLCGGMCAPGLSSENRIEGERFGTCASGAFRSACIVFGKRAAFSATGSPFFQR